MANSSPIPRYMGSIHNNRSGICTLDMDPSACRFGPFVEG